MFGKNMCAEEGTTVILSEAESIFNYFRRFGSQDIRKRAGKHDMPETLTCLVLGMLAGRHTQKHALQWCANHLDDLRKYMTLKNGIASPPTLCRFLKCLDEDDLQEIFLEWACKLVNTAGAFLSIDGKGMRGSAERISGERTPYFLNVIDIGTDLCVGAVRIGEKENEKVAFHQILELIDITGSLITADAMATDQNIINDIISRAGNFILQIKKNNPETYKQLFEQMEKLEEQAGKKRPDKAYEDALKSYSCEKPEGEVNRERIEYRTCHATNDITLLTASQDKYACLKTISVVESVRISRQKSKTGEDITPGKEEFLKQKGIKIGDEPGDDVIKVGVISSLALTAKEILEGKRAYWAVENKLHKILDETFREDRDTARDNRYRMGIFRRIAYNLMRIIQIREMPKKGTMMVCYDFCDCPEKFLKYIFDPIAGIR